MVYSVRRSYFSGDGLCRGLDKQVGACCNESTHHVAATWKAGTAVWSERSRNIIDEPGMRRDETIRSRSGSALTTLDSAVFEA